MRKTLKNVVHRSRMIVTYLVIGRHIYWGTKLVLSKMRPIIVRCKKHLLRNIPNTFKKQEIRRWRGDTSFEGRDTSRKRKFVSSEMWETSHRVKNDMHSLETKKRDVRRKRETRPLARNEKRETRNEKRDISYEKWDISRNVWHLTRNLVVDIEKVRQFQ